MAVLSADVLNSRKKRPFAATAVIAITASTALAVLTAAERRPQLPVAEGGAPEFESASVKANTSGNTERGSTLLRPGGRFTATNVTLRELIQAAYRRYGFDHPVVSDEPPWIDSERFDIVARAPGKHVLDLDGVPRQTWLMLRALLAERFKLKVHKESRELPVYELVMASSDGRIGPQLRESDVDCAAVLNMWNRGERPPTDPGQGPPCSFGPYTGRLVGNDVTMSQLAGLLSSLVRRPVVDRTDLAGSFDLEIEAVEIRLPGPVGPSARPSDTNISIFTALEEQLGLRLKSTTGPIDIIIIDHAEPLSPD